MNIRQLSSALLCGGLVGLVVFAASGTGCAPPPPPDESSGAAIVGGKTDTGDPSVVALYASTSQGGALCTASVIAPTVLLTAAHCVLPSEVGANATFTVLPSDDLNTSTTQQLAVKETHYDPDFDINQLENGHDIAVVILAKATTLAPLAVGHADPSALVGQSVRLVGYGLDNAAAQTGAGVKRMVTAPIDDVSARLIQIGGNGKDTCNGDSGGPALATVGGKQTIIGITSFGDSSCGSGGYDTRVDLYGSFLSKYVGSSSGSTSGSQTEKEPNDGSSQANELADGDLDGVLGAVGDVDWFTFTVPGPSAYSLSLTAARKSTTFRVYKMSAAGNLSSLGVAADADGVHTFDKNSAEGGIYYVKVYDDGAKHTDDGSYTLTLK
jgi:secreted trypsin-like serine protease